ncbi:hypothetical protein OPT61_g4737 [Boeremia exigua]|uniref:Uncharacterized protein n=1 Tax=Boeremia exigua TaxID=749465 RepID=A0ACC2ID35_9PLEO|nr:hypothetical protein OPT61_g4737 [Boeremia exigua]
MRSSRHQADLIANAPNGHGRVQAAYAEPELEGDSAPLWLLARRLPVVPTPSLPGFLTTTLVFKTDNLSPLYGFGSATMSMRTFSFPLPIYGSHHRQLEPDGQGVVPTEYAEIRSNDDSRLRTVFARDHDVTVCEKLARLSLFNNQLEGKVPKPPANVFILDIDSKAAANGDAVGGQLDVEQLIQMFQRISISDESFHSERPVIKTEFAEAAHPCAFEEIPELQDERHSQAWVSMLQRSCRQRASRTIENAHHIQVYAGRIREAPPGLHLTLVAIWNLSIAPRRAWYASLALLRS